jgi:AbrB family looped-hinge helix DNA binding protein
MTKVFATLTSKGQLTLPRHLRERWHLKPGDQIGFADDGSGNVLIEPRRRRSILEELDSLSHDLGRPVGLSEIEADLDAAVAEKAGRRS